MRETFFENPALKRMRAGEVALGLTLRLSRTGDFAHIARQADHDFIFIDMQHGPHNMETTIDMCLAAMAANVAPIVRLAGASNPDAARLLDCGAMGIVVPNVDTAEDARAAVRNCKFAPVGRRSVSPGYVQLGYAPIPGDKATAFLNEQSMLTVMIETRDGRDNLEEIVAVEGIDAVYLGTNDLLTELGLSGQYEHPSMRETVDRLLAACARHGVFAGLGGDKDPARQADFIKRGGRFITTQSEIGYVLAGASSAARALRAVPTR